MFFIACGLAALLMFFAGISFSNQGGRMFIQFQGQYFSIPENRLEMGYPFWLEPLFQEEVDDISVKILIKEVAEHYSLSLPRDFGRRSIYIYIPNHADSYPSRSVAEKAWSGIYPYSGNAGIQETDHYYAIRHDESNNIWAVLLHKPDMDAVPPLSDFWIGLCTASGGQILSAATTCPTMSDEKSIVWYSFRIDGDLIPYIDYFRRYFDDQIASWAGVQEGDI